MLCLSIQQPWAWAILHCGKDIENRSWFTNVRGLFLIHAGKRIDTGGIGDLANMNIALPMSFETGGIVGIAEIYDCVNAHNSKWFFGPYGFLLRGQRPLPFVPWRGQLGFFDVPLSGALKIAVDQQAIAQHAPVQNDCSPGGSGS
jgi:hypothetical protein